MTAANTFAQASPVDRQFEMGVAAATTVNVGELVVIDANGYIAPGSSATGLIAAGAALETADNSSGGNGDINVKYRCGIAIFDNDGGTPVVQADVGRDCYVLDANTVTGDATGRSRAGTVIEITSTGVAVQIGLPTN